jgi:hypothetical protein
VSDGGPIRSGAVQPPTVLEAISDLDFLSGDCSAAGGAGAAAAAGTIAAWGDLVMPYQACHPAATDFQAAMRGGPAGAGLLHNHRAQHPHAAVHKRMRTMAGDRLSGTITGQASGGARSTLHPNGKRPLSVRERCRLQSLPDRVEVQGNYTEQNQQVGNMVPPRMAAALGREFAAAARCAPNDWVERALPALDVHSYCAPPIRPASLRAVLLRLSCCYDCLRARCANLLVLSCRCVGLRRRGVDGPRDAGRGGRPRSPRGLLQAGRWGGGPAAPRRTPGAACLHGAGKGCGVMRRGLRRAQDCARIGQRLGIKSAAIVRLNEWSYPELSHSRAHRGDRRPAAPPAHARAAAQAAGCTTRAARC